MLIFLIITYFFQVVFTTSGLVEFYNNSQYHIDFGDDSNLVVLHKYNSAILLGGRDAAYNVSLDHMELLWQYRWPTSAKSASECKMIKKATCGNYIRTFYMKNASRMVLCGTHGHQPTCKEFELFSQNSYKEWDGTGLSPFSQDEPSPFLYSRGEIFTFNVPEYSGTDSILLRQNISNPSKILRTARRESVFDKAKVVTMEKNSEEELFTFFSERSSEHENGLQRSARIARVCMDDPGADYHKDEWSSFVKAKLGCGIKEEDMDTLYFPLLQGVAAAKDYFVGAFRSQLAALNGSALCIYHRSELSQIFRTAYQSFNQKKRCPRALSTEEQVRLRGKPLISSNIFTTPSFHYYGEDLFTAVTVQQNVTDLKGEKFDIWYIGTSMGRVMKVWFAQGKAHHISTFQFMKKPTQIKSIMIHEKHAAKASRDNNKATYLIIQAGNKLIRLPGSACSTFTSCATCLSSNDPSCAWVSEGTECVNIHENQHRRNFLTQDKCNDIPRSNRAILASTPPPASCTTIQVIEAKSNWFKHIFDEKPYILCFTAGSLVGSIAVCLTQRKMKRENEENFLPSMIHPVYSNNISRCSSHMTTSKSTYC